MQRSQTGTHDPRHPNQSVSIPFPRANDTPWSFHPGSQVGRCVTPKAHHSIITPFRVKTILAFRRIVQKIHLLQDALVVEPSRKAFDAALGLTAIRDLRGDVGQLHAFTPHDAADECGEGLHVSGAVACGWRRIGLREGMTDGTITASPGKFEAKRLCSDKKVIT